MFRAIYLTDIGVPVTYLASPDGSWCEVNRHPDHTGRHTVLTAWSELAGNTRSGYAGDLSRRHPTM